MVSLQDFSILSNPGNVSVCERDGRLSSLPMDQVDLSTISGANLFSYPEIHINRDLFHHPAAINFYRDDCKSVLVAPVNESLIKRLVRLYFEEGLTEALTDAINPQNAPRNPVVSSIANCAMRILELTRRFRVMFRPHLKDQEIDSLAKYSQTRDWRKSLIRYIKWHPNYFKIAVAANDDSIRVYTEEKENVPILKSSLQRNIMALAWRPFTAAEIAVGCQNGILLWTIDTKPASNISRSLSQAIHLKHGDHFPVVSLEWNNSGNLLASCSLNDSNILIWNVERKESIPLKRVGSPCSLLKWSPNDSKLFSSTVGNVFRVWSTANWQPERWTVPTGTIKSAAWSPCSQYILFITTDDPTLYCLRFIEEQLFTTSIVPKQAIPLANLTKVNVNSILVGGRAQSIAWSPDGKHLAISFEDSASIVLFTTSINRQQLSLAPDCFLNGNPGEYPSFICFKENYRNKTTPILTIGWSSGRVQYFPFL